jgi:hypothetical protein
MPADIQAPTGGLDEQRVQWVAKPDPVQHVTQPSRPDQPGRPLPCGHCAVKTGLLLETGNELHGAPGCPLFAGLNSVRPVPRFSGRHRMFARSGGGQPGELSRGWK